MNLSVSPWWRLEPFSRSVANLRLLVFSYKTCSASSNIYMPDLYCSVLHNLKLIEVTHSLPSTVTSALGAVNDSFPGLTLNCQVIFDSSASLESKDFRRSPTIFWMSRLCMSQLERKAASHKASHVAAFRRRNKIPRNLRIKEWVNC